MTPTTSEHGLRLDRIEITLAGRRLVALDRLVAPGETLSVMGPSGSGKSTLFSMIAGFLDPAFTASGRVFLDGQDITATAPEHRRIGLLFQDPLLFPHMSVGDNLLFALAPAVKGRERRRERVEAMMREIGLEGHLARDPATLSGGQAARVALARTLLAEPRALLLDEPFSRLDAARRQAVRELVFGCIRERGIPALLVTHDIEDARATGGPIVELAPDPAT